MKEASNQLHEADCHISPASASLLEFVREVLCLWSRTYHSRVSECTTNTFTNSTRLGSNRRICSRIPSVIKSSPHALNPPSLTGSIDGAHYLDVQVLSLLCKKTVVEILFQSHFWFEFVILYLHSKPMFLCCLEICIDQRSPPFTLKSMSRLIFPISLLIVVWANWVMANSGSSIP